MELFEHCTVSVAKANYVRLLQEGKTKDDAMRIALEVARRNINKCDERRRKAIEEGRLLDLE